MLVYLVFEVDGDVVGECGEKMECEIESYGCFVV